jgi:hypothetical protein
VDQGAEFPGPWLARGPPLILSLTHPPTHQIGELDSAGWSEATDKTMPLWGGHTCRLDRALAQVRELTATVEDLKKELAL